MVSGKRLAEGSITERELFDALKKANDLYVKVS